MESKSELLEVFIAVAGPEELFDKRVAEYELVSDDATASFNTYSSSSQSNINSFALQATISALQTIDVGLGETHNASTVVHINNRYVAAGINKWMTMWLKNGWMSRDGRPIKQREQWERLNQLLIKINGTIHETSPYDNDLMLTVSDRACASLRGATTKPGVSRKTREAHVGVSQPRAAPVELPRLAGQGMW